MRVIIGVSERKVKRKLHSMRIKEEMQVPSRKETSDSRLLSNMGDEMFARKGKYF